MGKLVIFDLDGTILDSLTDIADATNTTLREYGYPEHPVDCYRDFIGHGLVYLVECALGKETADNDPELLKNVGAAYRKRYGDICKNGQSSLFSGAWDMLTHLRANGIKLAIASNKPDSMTQDIVKGLPDDIFASVYGSSDDRPRKPDPAVVSMCMQDADVLDKTQVAYVGDSDVDMQTGKNAGIYTIGVSWGFRPVAELEQAGADIIAHTFGELQAALEKHFA